MKRKINLTIPEDLYAELERLPRGVSISEVASFLLRCYMETVKKRREINDEEFDAIIEEMGGEAFKERMKIGLGPTIDKMDWVGEKIKDALGLGPKEKAKKGGGAV